LKVCLDFSFNFPEIEIIVILQNLVLLMGKMIGLFLASGVLVWLSFSFKLRSFLTLKGKIRLKTLNNLSNFNNYFS